MYKPDFLVGDYFCLNRFSKPDSCQQIVILLSLLKLAAQCIIYRKGARKTGCGKDGKGEGRGREHSQGMNGRSKSRFEFRLGCGCFSMHDNY